MSLLRPLRDQLFKYQKRRRRSIDGSVPGIPHERFRRFTTPGLSRSKPRAGRYHHDLYMADTPTKYRPNIFAPAVDWTEYQQDEDNHRQFSRGAKNQHSFDTSLPEDPLPHHSSDELSMTEQVRMNMGVTPRPQEGPIPVEFEEIRHLLEGVRVPLHALGRDLAVDSEQAIPLEDAIHSKLQTSDDEQRHTLGDLRQITEALWFLEDRLPADHPDILNLRQAQTQLGRQQLFEIQQDPAFWEQYDAIDDNWQSNLGTGDPYANDDLWEDQSVDPSEENDVLASMQDFYEDEVSTQADLLPHYDEPVMEDEQDVELQFFADEVSDQLMAEETLPPELVLEELVEQEYSGLEPDPYDVEMEMPEATPDSELYAPDDSYSGGFMEPEVFNEDPVLDEIDQAMDQAAAFEQPEPDPWQMQYDPYEDMAQMMDMQMKYMANPFRMPGSMGPGYGPMGPM